MIMFLPRKLTSCPFCRFPSYPNKPKLPALSIHDFRSKISTSIAQIGFEPQPGLDKWFDLINTTNTAFVKIVVELDHPMTRWSERLTEEYLSHTLNLLSLLNSVASSLSRLSHAIVENKNHGVEFKPVRPTWNAARPASETESVLLRALELSRGIVTLSIGFVLSSLCGEAEPYMEIRKLVELGGYGDNSLIIKEMDSRFCKEVNLETECVFAVTRHCSKPALGDSIEGLEKRSDNMFFEVLASRNKLLDTLRLTRHNT